MSTKKKVAGGVVVCVIVAFVVAFAGPGRRVGYIGAGYAAKRLCSEVFLAERDPAEVWEVDLALLPTFLLSYSIDREAKVASSVGLGVYEQRAVYRPGLGCALTFDADEEEVRAMGFDEPRKAPPEDVEWPAGQRVSFERGPDEGVDAPALLAAIDAVFDEPDPENMQRTRAVVVVHRGRIIAERYAEGFGPETRLLSWSMAKSITNTMIGVLVRDGKLDVSKPPGLAAWEGREDVSGITTDMIMRMSSGLGFDETYGAFGEATEMLFMSRSASEYAASQPVAHAPDTHWSYSSGDTNLLAQLVREVIGDDAAYHRFPRDAIFDRIGASSAIFETDPSGSFVGSSFVYMTARDWARFGLLYQQDGVWGGERILPQGWVDYSCAPTKEAPLGEYGAQFWLNRGSASGEHKLPGAPDDVCAAFGFERQLVAVIPSREAVVVRLGLTRKEDAFDRAGFLARVAKALPERAAK